MDTPSTDLQPRNDKGDDELPALLDKLTERRRRLVLGVYSGLNPLQAARAAGIGSPEKEAYRLMKSPDVMACLAELRKRDVELLGITRKEVVAGLMDAVRAASNSMELTAAWREIGKLLGLYAAEKVEHQHKHEHELGEKTMAQLQQLPTNELLKIAGEDPLLIEGEFEVVGEEDCQTSPDDAQTVESS